MAMGDSGKNGLHNVRALESSIVDWVWRARALDRLCAAVTVARASIVMTDPASERCIPVVTVRTWPVG